MPYEGLEKMQRVPQAPHILGGDVIARHSLPREMKEVRWAYRLDEPINLTYLSEISRMPDDLSRTGPLAAREGVQLEPPAEQP